jgi:hypothetical protein
MRTAWEAGPTRRCGAERQGQWWVFGTTRARLGLGGANTLWAKYVDDSLSVLVPFFKTRLAHTGCD